MDRTNDEDLHTNGPGDGRMQGREMTGKHSKLDYSQEKQEENERKKKEKEEWNCETVFFSSHRTCKTLFFVPVAPAFSPLLGAANKSEVPWARPQV